MLYYICYSTLLLFLHVMRFSFIRVYPKMYSLLVIHCLSFGFETSLYGSRISPAIFHLPMSFCVFLFSSFCASSIGLLYIINGSHISTPHTYPWESYTSTSIVILHCIMLIWFSTICNTTLVGRFPRSFVWALWACFVWCTHLCGVQVLKYICIPFLFQLRKRPW